MTHADPAYRDTVLEFHADRPFTVDLRIPLHSAVLATLRQEISSEFAIITAHNPGGLLLSFEENAARARELEEYLRDRGFAFLRADGCSPDRRHREQGVAVEIPLERARRLAADFGQDALFWFDGESFWLVPSDPAAEAQELPAGR